MSVIGEKEKKDVIDQFQLHKTDTGSSEVQIALLTERINHLVDHLKMHQKDHHTRRGLLIMVGRRKRFLTYLQRTDLESFRKLTKKLKLKTKE